MFCLLIKQTLLYMTGVSFVSIIFLKKLQTLRDVILQLHADNPSFSFDIFYNTIKCLLDKHALLKETSKTKKRRKSSPWITKGILTPINKQDHLHKGFLKEKDTFLKSLFLESFKKYRNRIISLCKLSKSNYFHKFFSDNQKNIGKAWGGVKTIISLRFSAPPLLCA